MYFFASILRFVQGRRPMSIEMKWGVCLLRGRYLSIVPLILYGAAGAARGA